MKPAGWFILPGVKAAAENPRAGGTGAAPGPAADFGTQTSGAAKNWSRPLLWLTLLAVTAVVTVNVAGIWGIAVVRRGVLEEAERVFRLETVGRAKSIESVLASTRADLAFLAGSPTFFGLEAALASKDPREARWRRLGAEGSLLLFLRGHPEVAHLAVRAPGGSALVEVGRRGGVPVLWLARRPASPGRAEPGTIEDQPGHPRISGSFSLGPGSLRPAETITIEADIDSKALIAHDRSSEVRAASCRILDHEGRTLASDAAPKSASAAVDRSGEAIETEGWSAPSPWRLDCVRSSEDAVALLDPLARRYRVTLGLNLAVMVIALILGGFVIQQARRRRTMEARALEEARVRELERRLFHAERLSTVGRLAAGMAHEINNPLEGIANYLGLAREDLARGDHASARRRLDGVKEGLDRAAGIVRQVLAHASPATAPHAEIDLGPILRQSIEFVRSRGEFEGITFSTDLDGVAMKVKGSPAMLGQVFLNLLINACEAQPRGGEVGVAARRAEGAVTVEISDRGPGVPASDASRIFEPFYSTKDSTGLGLSVCWSIVREHGGEMSVEDRPGGGALFRVRLPAPA